MMRLFALCLAFVATLAMAGSAAAASIVYVRGAGDGHGIGMSQYGAYGYALRGKDYRFILAHYYQGTTIGTTDPDQVVRVLLGTGSPAFSGATAAGAQKLNPSVTYSVHANGDGSMSLTDPSGKKVGNGFAAPLVVTGSGPLSVAGLGAYRGALEFRPGSGGAVQTVDALGLDDYVRGVISAEMPSGWSAEALKVQAVAARTYAITDDVGGNGFNLYSDTRSQVYKGVSAETPATNAAVAATAGQVVEYDGAPAVTYFSASSGGHTENIENAWPGATPEPWLRGVGDPYDGAGGNPYHRWRLQVTTAAAAAKLGRLLKGGLVGIQVVKHGVSPRIVRARVVGTGGSTAVTGSQLEQAFGLMSTWAAFTTITTLPGPAPAPARRLSTAMAVRALLPFVRSLVDGTAPGIHGSVFPARPRDTVTIQVRGGHGWRTVRKVRVGRGGTYSAKLPSRGVYHVVYRGIDGPAVRVP
jgi:stage II sporulation protein D